jgi:pimeloyl-ACP methyl ester carboxylesterase
MSDDLPLVLIPGLLADHTTWRAQIEYFRGKYELIVPSEHYREPTIDAMAERLLQVLPPRFALVGTSMGGYISFEIMRKAAHRVTRLALISTSARNDPPENAQSRYDSIRVAREQGPAVAWRDKLGQLFYRPGKLSPDEIAALAAMNDRLGVDIYESQQKAIMSRADRRDVLSTITCPAIIICGTHDRWTPPIYSWEIASGIAGSELHLLAECSHCSPIEDPASVNALLSGWLQRSA